MRRAQACADSDWDDDHGQFIFYWIALSALCGQLNREALDGGRQRRIKYSDDDPRWLVERICELDREDLIRQALEPLKRKADNFIRDQYLVELYWRKAGRSRVTRKWGRDFAAAERCYADGDIDKYVLAVFRRLKMLRNQIFHGCSTDRSTFNKPSVASGVELLVALVPALLKVMHAAGSSGDWPWVPFPRKGSPQNPESLRRESRRA